MVFIATEPPGLGMAERCENGGWCPPWHHFLMERYGDITTRWNEILATYAQAHPDRATFHSITDLVCRRDVSPCDDTMDGVLARPDGTHYEGIGEDTVVDDLIGFLDPLLTGASLR
jgi:hypothetical protein